MTPIDQALAVAIDATTPEIVALAEHAVPALEWARDRITQLEAEVTDLRRQQPVDAYAYLGDG